jgi:hypothetical protein
MFGGGNDAANIISFTSDDDCLFAVSTLHAEDSAVLNAAPPHRYNNGKNREPEDDRHEA